MCNVHTVDCSVHKRNVHGNVAFFFTVTKTVVITKTSKSTILCTQNSQRKNVPFFECHIWHDILCKWKSSSSPPPPPPSSSPPSSLRSWLQCMHILCHFVFEAIFTRKIKILPSLEFYGDIRYATCSYTPCNLLAFFLHSI